MYRFTTIIITPSIIFLFLIKRFVQNVVFNLNQDLYVIT
eukprot:UN12271